MVVHAVDISWKARGDRIEGVDPTNDILEEDGLTDKEKVGFRYICWMWVSNRRQCYKFAIEMKVQETTRLE